MGASQTINCASFWNALVLKSILEQRGVRVHPPQEPVFLALTVSGPLDVITTTISELKGKYRNSWPIHIEGMEPAPSTPPSTNGARAPAADPRPSPGLAASMAKGMGASQTINCASFWNALVLKSILEQRGVRVHPPQEPVFLALTVSGPLDVIKTTISELKGKYRNSWPIHIEGMEPAPSTPPSTNGARAPAAGPRPSPAPRRCTSTTAKGSQCKLPAVPGGAKCAIHASARKCQARSTPAAEAMADPGAPEADAIASSQSDSSVTRR